MFVQSIFTAFVFLVKCTPLERPSIDVALACLLNVANVFFGLSSAAALNIAMFTALRRISIFMTMVAQYYFLGAPLNRNVFWSVVVMIFGSYVAAINDLTFSPRGYTYVMMNNVLTMAAQIQTKRALQQKHTKTSILFWTSILNICVAGACLIHWDPSSFRAWNEPAFQFAFACSVCLGFLINYGAAWTIEKNDALTLAVGGSTKSAIMGLMVVAGLFDRTYVFSWWNFVGLQISTIGSFLYVYHSNKKISDPTPKQESRTVVV